jgi:hypothetical protein
MPVSGYLFDVFNKTELALIFAIHNKKFPCDHKFDMVTIRCMKFKAFVGKITEAKKVANKEGVEKINIILNKIDKYMKG